MKRTPRAWTLAFAGLLSCLLAATADAQSAAGRRSQPRITSGGAAGQPVSTRRDIFEAGATRRAGRYFQDQTAPPAPEQQPPAGMQGESIAPGQMGAPDGAWSDGPQMGYGYPGGDYGYGHGGYGHGGYGDGCGCGDYGCDGYDCGGGYGGDCGCGVSCDGCECGATCGYFRWWENLSVFGGVQGFKGPVDFGFNPNFGFNEGANFAMPVFADHCIGGQVGFRTTQTNLNGNAIDGPDGNREQAFLTAGLFRRGRWLRGGAVIDMLNDEYYADFDLNQIRAELSMMLMRGGEFGVWTAVSGDQDEAYVAAGNFNTVWKPVDQYAFFYRRELCSGGNYRLWGGFTGNGDGLFGGEFLMPFSNRLALSSNFNYLIPQDSGQTGFEQEAWNIGINLVWYPGGRLSCGDCGASGLYDPMFRVADNGTFFVNRYDQPQNGATN